MVFLLSLLKFFFKLSVVCAIAGLLFVLLIRLVAWVLSQILGISVDFRVAGYNRLKDVLVTFKKGSIESISIGEIKISLKKPQAKIGTASIQKLQLLICDVEVVLRSSMPRTKKPKVQKSRSVQKGKLVSLFHAATFLSVWVTEVTVKVPTGIVEVKDFKVDVSKYGELDPTFRCDLQFIYFGFHIFDTEDTVDQPYDFNHGSLAVEGSNSAIRGKICAPLTCQDFSVSCELCHDREQGVKMENLDVSCGDIIVQLKDSLFLKDRTESKKSISADGSQSVSPDSIPNKKSGKSKFSPLALEKYISLFPEKVSFNMKKLDVNIVHRGKDLFVNNAIFGIEMRSTKSKTYDGSGKPATHFDFQLDFSEIHIFRDGATSILEVLKVAVITSIHVPKHDQPLEVEFEVKLGGIQCNLLLSRLKPWLCLVLGKKKPLVLHGENSQQRKKVTEDSFTEHAKVIIWTSKVSAPMMTIMVYGPNDLPLYHGCSHSTHLFANNNGYKGIQVHCEVGEFYLHMVDESQQTIKERLLGVEINSGSMVHIERVSIDWGHRELEVHDEHDQNRWKLVLAIDVTGMGVSFCFKHVETLIKTIMSFKGLLQSISPSNGKSTQNKTGRSSTKSTKKGMNILRISLDKCFMNYHDDVTLEEMTVADPKRVNFGSQGGEVLITVSADGTPRTARIMPDGPSGYQYLKFSASLDIFHLGLNLDKEKNSMQIEVEIIKTIYQEYPGEQNLGTKVTLLDVQKVKFVRRTGGLSESALCSFLNVTDATIRWEPDVHIVMHQFATCLNALLHNQKLLSSEKQKKAESVHADVVSQSELSSDQAPSEKKVTKKQSQHFAIDVEMLKVSAELADGVETMVHVQSIFSENVKIGVLVEELMLSFNETRVFQSSCLQISRIPVTATNNPRDAKAESIASWNWVIKGPDVYVCLPYRLQLRAIDDAVEDMLRGLKLVTAAKTDNLFPAKKHIPRKAKSKSTRFGSIRLVIHKLTAEIEEEPIQGWLDEHHQIMRNEICEAGTRFKFLEAFMSTGLTGNVETNATGSGKKLQFKEAEIDISDASSYQILQEEIHKKVFRTYYEACQKIVVSEGSGACTTGFQSGFKPSINRTSVLSLSAVDFDLTLTQIDGGNIGMIEFINKMDPISMEKNIPFSRMYGGDIVLNTTSLVLSIRNYTYPLLSATSGKCQGRIVLAQQATSFQPQILQDVFVGRWWRVRMSRSASGTTPPMKTYYDLPLHFDKGEVSFGVGYEPVFADISYAFTVALRRANLGTRCCANQIEQPKKERSLPWWDDMRNYIHGKGGLSFNETKWYLLGTTNPYENLDKVDVVTGCMDIQQRDGYVFLSVRDIMAYLNSLESLVKNCSIKPPCHDSKPFVVAPWFTLEVFMEWDCESGEPLNHYLYSLPVEGEPRKKVFDPFRSTSLSLRWNFSLKSCQPEDQLPSSFGVADSLRRDSPGDESVKKEVTKLVNSPTVNFAAHDLFWLFRWWNLYYLPPHKLRTFSRWPRFGVPRVVRSGNLSLDKVMTEFFLRIDSAPTYINHLPLRDDDPAKGMTFKMAKLKYEQCFSRGKQQYTFDCKRETLDLVYQGLDLHLLKVYLDPNYGATTAPDSKAVKGSPKNEVINKYSNEKSKYACTVKVQDDGFFLCSDYFAIRKQTSKADPARLLAWKESSKMSPESRSSRSEVGIGSESDHAISDCSDDDGFNVIIADNCQRVFIYGLKILWTIENRNAVWSFIGGITKVFEPPKPSPSKQYSQRKLLERQQVANEPGSPDDNALVISPSIANSESSTTVKHSENDGPDPVKNDHPPFDTVVKNGLVDTEEEGTCHFMVNVIQPQFNLHSEEANGRFLLAAASGRVLARSFQSVLHYVSDMTEQTLSASNVLNQENKPQMTWNRAELSIMLEHVQAHVAPTDVDPGAGIQWLPKILRDSPEVKRTGALLERVFMPCQMYFRYSQYKSGTPELKVKPLKELTFNSPNITAAMASRQFQVMLDVLSNLLFARAPKPRKNSLSYLCNDDDDMEEEIDEVGLDGVEEVDLAKIKLEQRERERRILVQDFKILAVTAIADDDKGSSSQSDGLWMITDTKSALVQQLKDELGNILLCIKEASSELRLALQKAAQSRLMEKEKNKSPSCAMRISIKINKVAWSMLSEGKSFAEAEINDLIYDFDRDYKDIGIAHFTIKSFDVRNFLANAKSNVLLSAWNPPSEWGKNVMLRVNARQGAPKDGNSHLEHFQVEIYPLKIHLTETMYTMIWGYLFPGEEQDTHKRQEVWKISTTSISKRGKKNSSASTSSGQLAKESESPGRQSGSKLQGDSSQVPKVPNTKASSTSRSNPKLRRTSSFDRTWEETVAESVANELVLQAHSSNSSSNPLDAGMENRKPENLELSKNKMNDPKTLKSGRVNQEEKKTGKIQDEKKSRPKKMVEFHNIRISQVELLLTYEGSRLSLSDRKFLMDAFSRDDFTGTWSKLFSRVRKHIIWGVLKSFAGMQGKKFKDKTQTTKEPHGGIAPENDLNMSDSDGGQPEKDQFPVPLPKKPNDGAGDGFVTSIKGLFNSQRRKAKALVLRTMRGEEDQEMHGEWSENDLEISPFARQLTITKTKRLIRRHTKKFSSRAEKKSGLKLEQNRDLSPNEILPFESDSSGASSYEGHSE